MDARLAVLGVDGKRNKAGLSFLAKGVRFALDARGEVPVWMEARTPEQQDLSHLVGSAKLSLHDEVLWADCRLLDDKLPGSLLKNLFPHAAGDVERANGSIIEAMLVRGINLSSDEPLDPRIPSLHVQGVKPRKKG